MVIEIDPKYEDALRRIADATGRSVDEVVQAAVERIISEDSSSPAQHMSRDKKAKMLARFEELRKLANPEPDDGLCASEDHDKIIYRIDR